MLSSACVRKSLVALWLCSSFASSAQAQVAPTCASGDRECGRSNFASGTASFDKGDYTTALGAFEAARSAGPHPIIAFNIALCWARLGKPTRALSELSALLSDPQTNKDLRQRAEEELRAAQTAVAHIGLEAPAGSAYTIELDGTAVQGGNDIAVDPGEHGLRVSNAQSVFFDQKVKLEPGERLRLRVTDQARSIDVVVVPQSQPKPAASQPAPERKAETAHKPLPPWAFYTAAGVSVVLAGVSVWSGVDVKNAYNDYRHDLPKLTQSEADQRVSDGHALERRTNVLWGVTAVSAVATAAIGLFWVDFGGKRRPVAVGVSPSGCTLRGSF